MILIDFQTFASVHIKCLNNDADKNLNPFTHISKKTLSAKPNHEQHCSLEAFYTE